MPVAASWRNDTLLVFDIEQVKVTSYTAARVVAGEHKVASDFAAPVIMSGEIGYVAVRADGTVLMSYPLQKSGANSDSAVLSVMSSRSSADTVSTVRVRVIDHGRSGILPQPGAPLPKVAVGSDGWLALAATDGTYRILIRDPADQPSHQICGDLPALALTPAERGQGEVPSGLEEPHAAIAQAPPPARLASVARMVVGPSGEIWVARTRAAPLNFAEGLFGVPGSQMDVFAADATFVGTVTVPSGVTVQAISGNLAIGLQFTADHEPWIIGYRVHLQ
jgi:hypothetical protein